MLGALKSSGEQLLQAEVRMIANKQGMTNLPSPAPNVPLSFLGLSVSGSHVGKAPGGSGLRHTHPPSSSVNVTFLVAK